MGVGKSLSTLRRSRIRRFLKLITLFGCISLLLATSTLWVMSLDNVIACEDFVGQKTFRRLSVLDGHVFFILTDVNLPVLNQSQFLKMFKGWWGLLMTQLEHRQKPNPKFFSLTKLACRQVRGLCRSRALGKHQV